MDSQDLKKNNGDSDKEEEKACDDQMAPSVPVLPPITAPTLTPSSSTSLTFTFPSSSFSSSSSSASASSSTPIPLSKQSLQSSSFPPSTCWYSYHHGDVICFSAANSKLQHQLQQDPLQSSHYATCAPLRHIAHSPQHSNSKEFWGCYNHGIRTYLRNWQAKFTEDKNSPYILYRDKNHTGEVNLPVACIHNFQNREFLSDLLVKYRKILIIYSDEIPVNPAEKMIRILGEFGDSVLDIMMEGGSLIVDSDEVQGMSCGDIIIHSLLLDEIKSVKATTLTALSVTSLSSTSTSTSTSTSISTSMKSKCLSLSTEKKKRKREEKTENKSVLGKEVEEISCVNNTIFDDICTKILHAAAATLKYQIVTIPHTQSIDTSIQTFSDNDSGILRSRVQDLLTPLLLPIPQGNPHSNFYPLLSDPTSTYLKSTTSFSTSFTAISLLSTTLSTPEKFLQTVFRIRFLKSTNRKRDLPCPYQCGAVYRRKLNSTELPYLVRTKCLSHVRTDDDEKASTYVPQVTTT